MLAYLRDANAAFLVYKCSRPESLSNVRGWLRVFQDNRSGGARAILVGTKMDMADWVNPLKEEAEALERQRKWRFGRFRQKLGKRSTQCLSRLLLSWPIRRQGERGRGR